MAAEDPDREAVALAVAGRLADLVPDLQDYARAWILGTALPHLDGDLAAVARRIAEEELERSGQQRLTDAADWQPDDE